MGGHFCNLMIFDNNNIMLASVCMTCGSSSSVTLRRVQLNMCNTHCATWIAVPFHVFRGMKLASGGGSDIPLFALFNCMAPHRTTSYIMSDVCNNCMYIYIYISLSCGICVCASTGTSVYTTPSTKPTPFKENLCLTKAKPKFKNLAKFAKAVTFLNLNKGFSLDC